MRRLTAFSVAADGTLADWGSLPGLGPDGICLDADGAVWVATGVTAECVRVAEGGHHPRSGANQTAQRCVHAWRPKGTTLFVVTASPMQPGGRATESRLGLIEQATVDVPGAGWP